DTSGLSPLRRLLIEHDGHPPVVADDLLGFPGFPLEEVEALPVVSDPTKVIAAPVNYFDHKAEMNEEAHINALGVFLKAPSSVTATGQTVELPYMDRRFDQEGEFALVIGRTTRNVSADDATAYIAG